MSFTNPNGNLAHEQLTPEQIHPIASYIFATLQERDAKINFTEDDTTKICQVGSAGSGWDCYLLTRVANGVATWKQLAPPLKTINGVPLEGTGNINFGSGGLSYGVATGSIISGSACNMTVIADSGIGLVTDGQFTHRITNAGTYLIGLNAIGLKLNGIWLNVYGSLTDLGGFNCYAPNSSSAANILSSSNSISILTVPQNPTSAENFRVNASVGSGGNCTYTMQIIKVA